MKKLVSGLVMLSALTSFAQSDAQNKKLVVENVTYGDTLTLECASADCEYMKMITDSNEYTWGKFPSQIFKRSIVMKTIKNRRGYRRNERYYDLSDDTLDNIQKNIKEGYNGKTVGNSALLVGAGIVDTAILLPQLLIQAITPKIDSRGDKQAAKRIKLNFESDRSAMKLKHKYYNQILYYINKIGIDLINPDAEGTTFLCNYNRKDKESCGSEYYDSVFSVHAVSLEEAESKCANYIDQSNYHKALCSVEDLNK